MTKLLLILLLGLSFSQDKWEFKFGYYYYSPIDSTKPVYLTQTRVLIQDSYKNVSSIFNFNSIDQTKVDHYLVLLKSTPLHLTTIENIIRSQEPMPKMLLNGLNEQEISELNNSFHISSSIMSKLSNNLQNLIHVYNTRNTDVLTIYIHSSYPSDAVFLINEFLDTFLEEELKFRSLEIETMQQYLEQELKVSEEELSKAEENLQSFQERKKIFGLDKNSELALSSLLIAEQEYYKAEAEMNILLERKKYLRGHLTDRELEIGNDAASRLDSCFPDLKKELSTLEVEYIQASTQVADDHLEIIRIKKKIEALKDTLEKIVNRHVIQRDTTTDPFGHRQTLINTLLNLELNISVKQSQLVELNKLIAEYESYLYWMPNSLLRYSQLLREVEMEAVSYSFFRQQLEEYKIEAASASQMGLIRIVDGARSSQIRK